jgi:hypothetical protein
MCLYDFIRVEDGQKQAGCGEKVLKVDIVPLSDPGTPITKCFWQIRLCSIHETVIVSAAAPVSTHLSPLFYQ